MEFNNIVSTCSSAKNDTVAGVLTKSSPLQIYNFLDQMTALAANPAACGTADATKEWQRNVSEDFINCCEANHMESNFFMDMFSSNPEEISTSTKHQRYRSNEDENVVSFSAGLDAAGTTQRFQLHKSSHSGNGTASSLYVGMQLYNYRNGQMVKITAINKNTANAFIVTVISTTSANVSILANDKFIRVPAVMVGGNSCKVGETTMNTSFTTKATNKFRLRTNWKMDLEVDKPYADKMMFAPFVDKNGVMSERALPTIKMRAMQEITQAANLMLFMGNSVTNTAISVDDWTGGEGLIEALRGAGKEWDYSAAQGFSLLNDFETIILQEDGKKSTTEWMLLGSLNFLANMTEKARKDTNNEITPLDFGTVRRYGANKETLEKHSVNTFTYLNRKVMYKEWTELNKSNGIGNGSFPDTGFMIALDGLKNNEGRSLPPIQFFRSANSQGLWEDTVEIERDNRYLETGCESIEGDIIKSVIFIINCPDNHYLLNPVYC